MPLLWNLTHALGLTAAGLIVALGAFVIAARPHPGSREPSPFRHQPMG